MKTNVILVSVVLTALGLAGPAHAVRMPDKCIAFDEQTNEPVTVADFFVPDTGRLQLSGKYLAAILTDVLANEGQSLSEAIPDQLTLHKVDGIYRLDQPVAGRRITARLTRISPDANLQRLELLLNDEVTPYNRAVCMDIVL